MGSEEGVFRNARQLVVAHGTLDTMQRAMLTLCKRAPLPSGCRFVVCLPSQPASEKAVDLTISSVNGEKVVLHEVSFSCTCSQPLAFTNSVLAPVLNVQ